MVTLEEVFRKSQDNLTKSFDAEKFSSDIENLSKAETEWLLGQIQAEILKGGDYNTLTEMRDIALQNIQKAVYVDNAQNRKLGRVGQQYGGKKKIDDEIEELKSRLFKEQSADAYNDMIFKLTDEKDGYSGKTAIDSKYGKYDAKEYLRVFYEFRDAPNSLLKSVRLNHKSNSPFDVADRKAVDEILEKRKAGDKMFQPKEKKIEEKTSNPIQVGTHNFVRALRTNTEGIEGDFTPSKECLKALRNYRVAAFNFVKKNPEVAKLSIDEILDMFNPDNYHNYADKYKGFEELYNAADDYYDWSMEFVMEDDISEKIEKKAKKTSEDAISAIISDQGQVGNDKESKKKLDAIKSAVIKFVKKNPDVNITISGWDSILNGEGQKKFGYYEGFDELDKVIDDYLG